MNHLKAVLCLVLVVFMSVAGLTAVCAEAGAPIVIADMADREVTMDGYPEKVFVDWASGITLAMTLNATDRLVAVPEAFKGDTFAWCRIICPALADIPADDSVFQNIEGVLNYEPDLVITSTRESLETYEMMGLPVIYVKFTDNESFQRSIQVVGQALGEENYEAALRFCDYMNDNIALARERTSGLSGEERPAVYYMDSRFSDAYHTVGKGEIQENWIESAGGRLATADLFEGRNIEITVEQFLSVDPDIILVGAQNQAAVTQMLLSDPVLCELTAVKNGNVYRIPQGMFPWCRTGPESAMQAIWAGKLLHPELFEDIDIMALARDFYQRFYGAAVEDEYLEGILAGKLTPDGD